MIQKSTSLEYEPSSEPLRITAKQLFLDNPQPQTQPPNQDGGFARTGQNVSTPHAFTIVVQHENHPPSFAVVDRIELLQSDAPGLVSR